MLDVYTSPKLNNYIDLIEKNINRRGRAIMIFRAIVKKRKP